MPNKNETNGQDIRDKFDRPLFMMRMNNHFASFLDDQITSEFVSMCLQEVEDFSKEHKGKKSNLILHKLPMDNKIFNDLQLIIKNDDEAYLREWEAIPDLLSDDDNILSDEIERFLNNEQDINEFKQSAIAVKIRGLATNFAEEIKKINKETGIPFVALSQIHALMTSYQETMTSLKNHDQDMNEYLKVQIPDTIPAKKRDRLLLKVCNNIHNLLVECYWVLYIVAAAEILTILMYCGDDALEEAKAHLFHTTVYPALEERIFKITTTEELIEYIFAEFSSFFLFFPEIGEFVRNTIRRITEQRAPLLDTRIVQRTRNYSRRESKISKEKIDAIQERVFGSMFEETESGIADKNLDESMIDDLVVDGSEDEDSAGEDGNYLDDDSDDGGWIEKNYPRDRIKRGYEGKDASDGTGDKITFSDDMSWKLFKKLETGLLAPYRLTGSPRKPINYLRKILRNIGVDLTAEHYSEVIKAKYGIKNPRTLRRYTKDIKEGKIKVRSITDNPNENFGMKHLKIKDLEPEDVDSIFIAKKQSQKHEVPGYLTQRGLIEALQKDAVIKRFKKEGIGFKKMSSPTLLSRLKILIDSKKIEVEKTKTSYLYKSDDKTMKLIVTEIMKLK